MKTILILACVCMAVSLLAAGDQADADKLKLERSRLLQELDEIEAAGGYARRMDAFLDYKILFLNSTSRRPSSGRYSLAAIDSMPWGNERNLSELPCDWERIEVEIQAVERLADVTPRDLCRLPVNATLEDYIAQYRADPDRLNYWSSIEMRAGYIDWLITRINARLAHGEHAAAEPRYLDLWFRVMLAYAGFMRSACEAYLSCDDEERILRRIDDEKVPGPRINNDRDERKYPRDPRTETIIHIKSRIVDAAEFTAVSFYRKNYLLDYKDKIYCPQTYSLKPGFQFRPDGRFQPWHVCQQVFHLTHRAEFQERYRQRHPFDNGGFRQGSRYTVPLDPDRPPSIQDQAEAPPPAPVPAAGLAAFERMDWAGRRFDQLQQLSLHGDDAAAEFQALLGHQAVIPDHETPEVRRRRQLAWVEGLVCYALDGRRQLRELEFDPGLAERQPIAMIAKRQTLMCHLTKTLLGDLRDDELNEDPARAIHLRHDLMRAWMIWTESLQDLGDHCLDQSESQLITYGEPAQKTWRTDLQSAAIDAIGATILDVIPAARRLFNGNRGEHQFATYLRIGGIEALLADPNGPDPDGKQ
jgi:hypothetical protein